MLWVSSLVHSTAILPFVRHPTAFSFYALIGSPVYPASNPNHGAVVGAKDVGPPAGAASHWVLCYIHYAYSLLLNNAL